MAQWVWSPYFYISENSRTLFLPMANKPEVIQQGYVIQKAYVIKANYTQEFFGWFYPDPDEI